ncbi:NAD(P)/FAD-dependent oxidoreductase [Nonomuraea zeae]|uniref:FAD-dependent oxidoreductase n=1 Tax=Nonomuraea zeae TaxID=1642303 RepID=A0A5S4FH46_9ACTN|nr:FAD-dependent oxidoreductase [Nonomuraea zeae]TMR18667.1 FAD-dependent oxidoreductase [Nonomuraea zeae]
MSRTVAVIGGGYGGAAAAKALDADTDVILIEPRDAFVQNAVSLRALARPEWAEHLFFPYDKLLRRGRVVHERAARVDAGGVTLASGARVDADYLVLATGSDYPYPFKTGADLTRRARERLLGTHEELAKAERVLITGAGPVGLELAGEIKAVWPDKHVTIVDPAQRLLPGFEPALIEDLHRQLDALGVDLRLGTTLTTQPPAEPGLAGGFTVESSHGRISADIWFRAHGVRVKSDFLGAELAAARTPAGHVRVTETLNVEGFGNVYAVGDLTDLAEAKMAGNAMQHAETVAANIISQVRGERPTARYVPSPLPFVLLPLGPGGGVGQVPSENGPLVLPAQAVADYKGADLFTGRFAELFGTGGLSPAA